jgi:hypothetical protein
LRLILFLALVIVVTATIIAAVFFRSRRAWDVLHTIRKYGWVYVTIIVLSAIYRLWIG